LPKPAGRKRVAGVQQGCVTHIDSSELAGRERSVPPEQPLIAAARSVCTSFGDE